LDIGPHEVLGIFLKHVVDLVEQVVGLCGKLLAASSSPPPPPRLVCS
jgi:hypothetical protein